MILYMLYDLALLLLCALLVSLSWSSITITITMCYNYISLFYYYYDYTFYYYCIIILTSLKLGFASNVQSYIHGSRWIYLLLFEVIYAVEKVSGIQ